MTEAEFDKALLKIDSKVPGLELDKAVAEFFMGEPEPPNDAMIIPSVGVHYSGGGNWRTATGTEPIEWTPLPFSTSFQYLEKMLDRFRELGWGIQLDDERCNPQTRIAGQDHSWWYELVRWDDPEYKVYDINFGHHYWKLDGHTESAPLAVCHAAMKAILHERYTHPGK